MALPEHTHCKVCGKVAPPNAETCSPACREIREARMRSRRNWSALLYILIVVFAFILLIELLH
ncbi:MAG: DUF2116 family Zn-ribbon domain-containing protein [Thermoplasmatales archaeon]|nr:DUF2116 family Zn-ribbon domain-containing protein [Thermoplasmatales archaeon]